MYFCASPLDAEEVNDRVNSCNAMFTDVVLVTRPAWIYFLCVLLNDGLFPYDYMIQCLVARQAASPMLCLIMIKDSNMTAGILNCEVALSCVQCSFSTQMHAGKVRLHGDRLA